jgi:hypothetical protein
MSERYRDQQNNALDTAVFWVCYKNQEPPIKLNNPSFSSYFQVEYIKRHKGAPHLRVRANNLSFIEYHNLDVIAILILMIIAIIGIPLENFEMYFWRETAG